VTGANSRWDVDGLTVGDEGTGSLTISSGGLVDGQFFSDSYIGDKTGSTGSVNVTGANSVWRVGSAAGRGSTVYVGGRGTAADGRNGNGTLQIFSSGFVQAGYLQVFDTGSAQVNNGSSTVSGLMVSGDGIVPEAASSPLGALTVGNTASARMVVQTGGTVSNSLGTIAANSGTVGSVLVDGANSTWTNTDQLSVGHNGTGTLEVRNGGTLTSVRGFAGAGANSSGTITISDPGSTWNASGSFFIGNSGAGLLQVFNGGVASTAGNCHLGITPGANGDVNVSGAGSTMNVAVLLNIGGDSAQAQGSGSVRIADGGTVNVGTATNLYSTGRLDIVNETTFTGDLNSFGGLIRVFGNTTVANAVHLNTGGVAIVNFTAGTNSTFSGNIDGSGGLLKGGIAGFTGLGTLTLTGANTYLGATTINAGTLLVNGSITSATTVNTGATLGGIGTVGTVTVKNGGILSPGNSPGLLTAAAVTFGSGVPKLAIELGGTAPGTQYDQLIVTGNLSLAGALTVSLIDGFAPVAGHAFDILDWGSLSGTFASINLPTLAGGLAWNTSQLYATGLLSVGLPGDYNNNGEVDAADYVAWRKGLGTMYTQSDYDVWRSYFGQTAGSGAALPSANSLSAAVPEPATLLLLTFTSAGWCLRRGRPA
jgi:T5SS/PEP-CTERM-associated repeat protein/autotransporter-associated beta strand protein